MFDNQIVYTEKNNCQDCYNCVRECPVKAIKIEAHNAVIDRNLCINCGNCTIACSVGAIKLRNDLDKVKDFVNSRKKIILSIDPSYISEYSEYSDSQIISAIKALGINDVSETALGAEIVSNNIINYLKNNDNRINFSSCCPAIVALICKYYPNYKKYLIPIMSPMVAHGKMLKKMYGKDIKVVFLGPCIAKKMEADEYKEYIDAVITFKNLKEWMDEKSIKFSDFKSNQNINFIPSKSNKGTLSVIEGGILKSIKKETKENNISLISISGLKNIKSSLKNLEQQSFKGKIFVDLMACEGGCINGPACENNISSIIKKHNIISVTEKRQVQNLSSDINIEINYNNFQPIKKSEYTKNQISEILKSIGKFSPKDEINCGGCGYDTCRNFAAAILDGKANSTMCFSYLRKISHNKFTAMLNKLPSGIVIVNENLRIIEANINFAKILGDEIKMIFENKPGLENADIKKLLPFHELISSVLQSGEELIESDIKIEGKPIKISIVNIQKHKIICAIMKDMEMPQIKKDHVIERTRKVINENMQTVQKIAYLLGENASHTEDVLNSIIESYKS